MYRFKTTETHCFSPSLGDYTCFGILAEQEEASDWRAVDAIPDVSCDKSFVENLCQQCTLLQLSPLHLWDVALDCIP